MIAIAIISITIMITFLRRDNSKVPSCEAYRNYPMKDVPVRCMQHFVQNS